MNYSILSKYLCLFIMAWFIVPEVYGQKVYTLDECIEMADINNNTIKNSKIDIQIAESQSKAAYMNFFPKITAGTFLFKATSGLLSKDIDLSFMTKAQVTNSLGTFPIKMLSSGHLEYISAIQPIFAGKRISNSYKLSKVNNKVSYLQHQINKKNIHLKIESCFWNLISLKGKLNSINASEKLLRNIRNDVLLFIQKGLALSNDLLVMDLKLKELHTNHLKVNDDINIYKSLLKSDTGIKEDSFDIEKPKDETFFPDHIYVNPSEALKTLPEKQLLDLQIKANVLQSLIEKGSRLPSVNIGGSFIHHNLIGKNTNSGLIFTTISIPISSWWEKKRSIKNKNWKYGRASTIRLKHKIY